MYGGADVIEYASGAERTRLAMNSDQTDNFLSMLQRNGWEKQWRMPGLKYLETKKIERNDYDLGPNSFLSNRWKCQYILSQEDAAMYVLLYGDN